MVFMLFPWTVTSAMVLHALLALYVGHYTFGSAWVNVAELALAAVFAIATSRSKRQQALDEKRELREEENKYLDDLKNKY